ncbi:type II toxin-antitoxin system prevent-host-death family antitoxin [Pelistega ratti]|uniref:type II toxin-antitoxin system prevent-host-death family antitoxin n=1 Tax=Pelistega ratti TaxID=2652177 RepID=UPI00135A2FB0|nr:type II toxin-antitoxin system prevent-host-death family antitoxin [Pelistega ratti]
MHTITYTEARQNLSKRMQQTIDNQEAILITRSRGGNCVLMSEEQYSALQETAYLLRSPKNVKRLLESIEELKSNQGIELTELSE